jgi:hypothetical protein
VNAEGGPGRVRWPWGCGGTGSCPWFDWSKWTLGLTGIDMDFRCPLAGAPGMTDCRQVSITGEGVRGGRSNTAVNTPAG